MKMPGIALSVASLTLLALLAWQWTDRRADQAIWHQLIAQSGQPKPVFDYTMTQGLPDPAQRYFRYMIREGTPLVTAVEIEMKGELGLGTATNPTYRDMRAQQLLSPPYGLVWDVKAGALRGSDVVTPETSWTRFWLYNVIPVVRVGGAVDHHRSAFGRVIAEAALWVPASLLPSSLVRWEEVDQTTARAIVTFAGFEQAVNITVAADGRPTRVVIPRWSNENPEKVFREQPFGGELSDFKAFGGYTLPTRVTGGNQFGTQDYFPFYRVSVLDVRFPTIEEHQR